MLAPATLSVPELDPDLREAPAGAEESDAPTDVPTRWPPRSLGAAPLLGAVILAVFAACALFAPLLAPHDPNYQYFEGLTAIGEPLPPGSPPFWLGTDMLGRDLLSRLIYGARVAMFIAVVPNALALVLALVVGTIAGAYGGWLETGLMRFTETMMVLPTFLLALALLTVLGPGLGVVVGALVLVSWTYPARVVYGETLRLRETTFVEAARAMGASTPWIIVRHIVPQLRALLLIYFTLNAATMVLLEAGLGFLGFGVQPPTPSWGAMINEGRNTLFWPWLILEPGVCLALLGTGFYLVGIGLQRATGPRFARVRL
jgi:peptide/nickel transport system permease protein